MININKLQKELETSGIPFSGCNIDGIVWGADGVTEIQKTKEVKAILDKHDPTPEKEIDQPTTKELLQRIDALEKKVK